MTDHHTYGTSTHATDELVRLASGHLRLVFTEHDSYFRGIYHLADAPDRRIEIQPNLIPGDDGEEDLYNSANPDVRVLLLTTTPAPDPALHAHLGSIEGLVHLNQKSW